MKLTKLISLVLVTLMIAAMAAVPSFAAADAYTSAKDGDLLYTVNYAGDANFKPGVYNNRMTVAVDPADNTKVVLTNPAALGKNEGDWWGGRITNLPLNDTTKYTIYFNAARLEAVDASVGFCFDGIFTFYGYHNKTHWLRYGSDLTSSASHPYVTYADKGITVAADGKNGVVEELAVEINGENKCFAAYIKDTAGKWQLIDKTTPGEINRFHDDVLNIIYYVYTGSRPAEISATKIYKGLMIGQCETAAAPAPAASVAISNAAGLATMETGKNYHLTGDIDLGGMKLTKPLLDEYSGTIDGKGFSIYNFSIEAETADSCGLFKVIAKTGNTLITNLNIGKSDKPVQVKYTLTADSKHLGVLAGQMEVQNGAVIKNVNIYADMTVDTQKKCNVGGFIGYSRDVLLQDCTMNGKITVGAEGSTSYKNAAGFIGSVNTPIKIIDCKNNAEINTIASTTEARAGGIVAYTGVNIQLRNCENTGKINIITKEGDSTCNGFAAGIIADINGAPAVVDGCINRGDVTLNTTCEKAFVSSIAASVKKGPATIINCKSDAKYSAAKVSGVFTASVADGVTVEQKSNVDLTVAPPPTGDSLPYILVIASVALLCGAVTVYTGKKRKENG